MGNYRYIVQADSSLLDENNEYCNRVAGMPASTVIVIEVDS